MELCMTAMRVLSEITLSKRRIGRITKVTRVIIPSKTFIWNMTTACLRNWISFPFDTLDPTIIEPDMEYYLPDPKYRPDEIHSTSPDVSTHIYQDPPSIYPEVHMSQASSSPLNDGTKSCDGLSSISGRWIIITWPRAGHSQWPLFVVPGAKCSQSQHPRRPSVDYSSRIYHFD